MKEENNPEKPNSKNPKVGCTSYPPFNFPIFNISY